MPRNRRLKKAYIAQVTRIASTQRHISAVSNANHEAAASAVTHRKEKTCVRCRVPIDHLHAHVMCTSCKEVHAFHQTVEGKAVLKKKREREAERRAKADAFRYERYDAYIILDDKLHTSVQKHGIKYRTRKSTADLTQDAVYLSHDTQSPNSNSTEDDDENSFSDFVRATPLPSSDAHFYESDDEFTEFMRAPTVSNEQQSISTADRSFIEHLALAALDS